jgi:fluoroquinolone transport system permease protein
MNVSRLRALGTIDAQSIARDSLLRWMVVLAPAIGLVFRFGAPRIDGMLEQELGFDLTPYFPLLMSFLPLVAAGLAGTVSGFLLLDQRDDRTLTAILVTPLRLGGYLRYRLTAVILLSAALGSIMVPLAGLSETSLPQVVLSASVAAPLAPIYALFLGTFAANKVQGFALAKAIGVVFVPCVAAYFVTGPWQSAFGLLPHYWPLKVFWLFDEEATAAAMGHALLGLGWQGTVLAMLVRRFSRVLKR